MYDVLYVGTGFLGFHQQRCCARTVATTYGTYRSACRYYPYSSIILEIIRRDPYGTVFVTQQEYEYEYSTR